MLGSSEISLLIIKDMNYYYDQSRVKLYLHLDIYFLIPCNLLKVKLSIKYGKDFIDLLVILNKRITFKL